MTTYKIGTRGSLLAVTQSTLVKNQLEALSGDKFELVTIKTQGDEITNKPLWQLEGKDFFTKELDEALLKGEVDLVIHSYKDLGSIRPAGIKLAAVTERRFAHDILLIPQKNIDALKNWQGDFIVGTSSPRRIVNLTRSLSDYLPYVKSVRCETLRGNVNSRIRKLKEGQYHAITLALAGIERLSHTPSSAHELQELLNGLNYFILPQSVFPSAASQGALGIETREDRADNGKLLSIIGKLAHEKTIEEVFRERKAFKEFGGGCHLAVGIHVKKIAETFLHVHVGEVDGKQIEKKWLEGLEHEKLPVGKKLFVGLPQGNSSEIVYDQFLSKITSEHQTDLSGKHVFVTSRYCIPTLKASFTSGPEALWAAGTKTAKLLSESGFWVNGTSDSLGTDDLELLKTSQALKMIHQNLKQEWVVLSHTEATSVLGPVQGCYERKENDVSAEYENQLKQVGACYWTSYPQYQAFIARFPFLKESRHFCGLGKTYQEFQKTDAIVYPVASMEEFYSLV
jgi:hydroxymethylbilane synthase